MQIFSVTMGKSKTEFSVIGIADVYRSSVHFQGLLNGIPFTQHKDYEKVRARVLKAIDINNQKVKEN